MPLRKEYLQKLRSRLGERRGLGAERRESENATLEKRESERARLSAERRDAERARLSAERREQILARGRERVKYYQAIEDERLAGIEESLRNRRLSYM